MPNWTQGKWSYTPLLGYQYVVVIEDWDKGRRPMLMLVAHGVPTGREAEVKANLTLAAAAPDLYAALGWAIDKIMGPGSTELRAYHIEAIELRKAFDALAKARGEKPDAQ